MEDVVSDADLNPSSSSSHILILSSSCTLDTMVVLVVVFITLKITELNWTNVAIHDKISTVHSPRTAPRPVTCLGDRRQTCRVPSQLRAAAPARTAAARWCMSECVDVREMHVTSWVNVAVRGSSCCIDVIVLVTSKVDVLTSTTGSGARSQLWHSFCTWF